MTDSKSVSSKTVATGPGIIDYGAWETYYHETRKTISAVKDDQARRDLMVMFENVQGKWLIYSRTSLNYKRHNEKLYKEFEEAQRNLGKYIMMAGLKF